MVHLFKYYVKKSKLDSLNFLCSAHISLHNLNLYISFARAIPDGGMELDDAEGAADQGDLCVGESTAVV